MIVAAENPDLKLLPGMTASISFEVDERPQVIKVPNSALRFYPNVTHVRPEDQKLVDGQETQTNNSDDVTDSGKLASAEERNELRRSRNRRHVWVVDGGLLRAVEIVTGLSDSRYTELISGDLKPGDNLVTGQIMPVAGSGR